MTKQILLKLNELQRTDQRQITGSPYNKSENLQVKSTEMYILFFSWRSNQRATKTALPAFCLCNVLPGTTPTRGASSKNPFIGCIQRNKNRIEYLACNGEARGRKNRFSKQKLYTQRGCLSTLQLIQTKVIFFVKNRFCKPNSPQPGQQTKTLLILSYILIIQNTAHIPSLKRQPRDMFVAALQ